VFFSLVPYSAKQKAPRVSSIDTNNDIVSPLDYSFFRISNIESKFIFLVIVNVKNKFNYYLYHDDEKV
jgi:hypothetical protein